MPAIAYNGVMTTGHGKYKPTKINASQSKVFVSGQPILIVGDLADNHGHDPVGMCVASQSKIFINGVAAMQIGDSLSDGDRIAQGSPKVFIK